MGPCVSSLRCGRSPGAVEKEWERLVDGEAEESGAPLESPGERGWWRGLADG